MKEFSLVKYVDSELKEKQLESFIKELINKHKILERRLKKLKLIDKGTKEAVDIILKEGTAKLK